MSFFRSVFLALFLVSGLSHPAFSQDGGRTILVLDASGSMWGQIDGKAKITIAQEVVNGLLGDIPADQHLGLTVYGHRRKGDCKDIETLVEPGENTRSAISSAVNAIKPKGKTPLSAAVIAAAEALKYTEERATVILVSDGKETCDFDPCKVGTQLEESGVDFTAHVVGFDIEKPVVKAQLQCLAENTGGRFISAANADELTTALEVVSAPPPPIDREILIRAMDGPKGPIVTENLIWTLTNQETGQVTVEQGPAERIKMTLTEGTYLAEVLRTTDEATAQLVLGVSPSSQSNFIVELPQYKPAATLEAPDKAVAGSLVSVKWTGPNDASDYLATANEGDRPSKTITYSYTRDGEPLHVQIPPTPGFYELRYVHNDTLRVLASKKIEVLPLEVSIDLPDTATVGETLMLSWKGPNYHLDYLSTANPGDRGSKTLTYNYTKNGQPLGLEMPAEPGEYEVRYVLNQNNTIVFSKMISVGEVQVSLDLPDTATAGDTVMVNWIGPNYNLDYLSVAEIGARGSQTINYSYTRDGSPLGLAMPTQPGTYEVRYVLNQGNTILATKLVEIVKVDAALNIPKTAVAGSTLQVDWKGPNYHLDYLSVAEIGDRGSKTINYSYTRDGSPIGLAMPVKPGTYEVRYVLNQGNDVIATELIEITQVSAILSAPTTATVEGTIAVNWSGPGYPRDYISLAEVGSRGSQTISYAYTRDSDTVELKMPKNKGTYEIRYVVNQGNTVIAHQLIEVK